MSRSPLRLSNVLFERNYVLCMVTMLLFHMCLSFCYMASLMHGSKPIIKQGLYDTYKRALAVRKKLLRVFP
jgi:hypothetical protein